MSPEQKIKDVQMMVREELLDHVKKGELYLLAGRYSEAADIFSRVVANTVGLAVFEDVLKDKL